MDFQIGPTDVAMLVLGVTQGVKAIFDVEGKTNIVIAFGVGFVLVSVSHGIAEGLIPPGAIPYIEWFVTSLAGALAAIGAYEFGKSGVKLYRKVSGDQDEDKKEKNVHS